MPVERGARRAARQLLRRFGGRPRGVGGQSDERLERGCDLRVLDTSHRPWFQPRRLRHIGLRPARTDAQPVDVGSDVPQHFFRPFVPRHSLAVVWGASHWKNDVERLY